MPIRFRCSYCNQLMGIARRKAGTIVTCPTCSGKVVVPQPSTSDQMSEEPPAAAQPPLFEASDFEDVLQISGSAPSPPPQPQVSAPPQPVAASRGGDPSIPSGAWGTNADPVHYDVEPIGPQGVDPTAGAPAAEGIVVSPMTATILTVVMIVLLAIAFGAGVLVGKFLLS